MNKKLLQNIKVTGWSGTEFILQIRNEEILTDLNFRECKNIEFIADVPDEIRNQSDHRTIIGISIVSGYLVTLDLSVTSGSDYRVLNIYVRPKPKNRFKLSEISMTPIEYVTLKLGQDQIDVQSDGYIVYAAPTGQGKTYFALDNMELLCKQFDRVVILAYEITPRDYMQRLMVMYKIYDKEKLVELFKDKIEICMEQDIDELKKYYADEKIVFVVDNVDNISLVTKEAAFYQAEWLKEFDRFLKDNGYFGILLSQLNNKSAKEKYENITLDYVAGSKERVDLARSVFFTWYDEDERLYQYKALKFGTMKTSMEGGKLKWKRRLDHI